MKKAKNPVQQSGAADDLMAMAMTVPTPISAASLKPKPKEQPKPETPEPERTMPEAAAAGEPASGAVALPDGAALRARRATERLNLRIQPALKADLEALAKSQGVSMSEYILELIRQAVAVAGRTEGKP